MPAEYVRAAMGPQLMGLPAWVILPLPYLLFTQSQMAMILCVAILALAIYLKKKGRTLMWTLRRIKTTLRGYRMDARPLGYRRVISTDVMIHDFDFDSWRKK